MSVVSPEMTNPTLQKFGYPETLIKRYSHWCVLARPAQVTLGSLVLVCTDKAEFFSDISRDAFAGLARVTKDIETATKAFRAWQKINYLMLMMVDKDVHFHVIPRYDEPQDFAGKTFHDTGWPGPPDLANAISPEGACLAALHSGLKQNWPE